MKKLLLLILMGVAQFSCTEGKRKRVFFREVTPTTTDAIIRSQRGVFSAGYQNKVVEQHNAATTALEEARLSTQATELLTENLQASIKLRQQLGGTYSHQMPFAPGPIRLVDQYGNEVIGMPMLHPQVQSSGGYSYPVPQPQRPSVTQTLPQKTESEQFTPVETQNAYLPPHPQPQPQSQGPPQSQLTYSQAQYLPPSYLQPVPQPEYLHPQPHLIQTQFQPQPQLIQQFVTAEGLVFHQLVEQLQLQPQPLPQQEVYHHPQDHYHPQTTVVQEPLQVYHHPHPIPISVQTPAPLPVVEKVVPTVTKTVLPVQEVPTVKLVKQPILPPAVFQKEIFAVKNPAVRVLTFSDLCTVYPYQRKLSACVYKKAAIPELHHPDIQLVPDQINAVTQMPEQTKIVTQTPRPGKPGASYGQRKINPRTSPLKLNAPRTSETSIQDILGHESKKLDSSSSSEEGGEVLDDEVPTVDDEENSNIAESSNKNEELVIKTTKPKRTSSISSTPRSTNRNRKGTKSVATRRPTTPSTTPEPSTISTSTKKSKKSKRRSRKSKARRAERKKKLRDSTSTMPTTTIEELFRLA